jgi:micrococcal nuclease
LKSRDFLRGQIAGKKIIIQTINDQKGKFGRYLAEIWLPVDAGDPININDLLVSEGFAIYKD